MPAPRFSLREATTAGTTGTPIYGGWLPDRAPYVKEEVINDPGVLHPVFNAGAGAQLRATFTQTDTLLWPFLLAYFPAYARGAQAIGSCVGWGAEIACTILCCKAWKKNRERRGGKTIAEVSTEACYGLSRVEGAGRKTPAGMSDGANGGHAARGLKDWGAVLRLDHSKTPGCLPEHDLRSYNAKTEKDWGNYGCGGDFDTGKVSTDDALDKIARIHPVKTITYCDDFTDVAAAISGAQCPVTIASQYGCSMKRNAAGECGWSGSWAHQMCLIGVRFGSNPGALCAQSWGPNSASGPSGDDLVDASALPKGGTPKNILGFVWWIPASDVDRICKSGEAIAYGDLDGWHRTQLTYQDWFKT